MGGRQTSGHQEGRRIWGLLVELQDELLAGGQQAAGCYKEDMTVEWG